MGFFLEPFFFFSQITKRKARVHNAQNLVTFMINATFRIKTILNECPYLLKYLL